MEYQYIGDIAKRLGVSTRTIRYYEELNLIVPKRSTGGFREYSEHEVGKIETVLSLKRLGFSLEDIQKFIRLKHNVNDKDLTPDFLEYLHKRLHELEDKITEYKRGKKEISSLIQTIENCSDCKEKLEKLGCEKCFEKQDKKMPKLMKRLL
jgi:DNA-binding transcriptional MerR regulator